MTRLVLTAALGVAFLASGLGCGSNNKGKSEVPKEEQQIINKGTDNKSGGAGGSGKADPGLPAGTAQ
jgi:hypothetical protein